MNKGLGEVFFSTKNNNLQTKNKTGSNFPGFVYLLNIQPIHPMDT